MIFEAKEMAIFRKRISRIESEENGNLVLSFRFNEAKLMAKLCPFVTHY